MNKKPRLIDLIFEKIPPFLTWMIILTPIWGGIFFPNETSYLILALNIYFLYRSISTGVLLLIGVILLRTNESINWLSRLEELDNISQAILDLKKRRDILLTVNEIKTDTKFNNDRLNKLLNRRLPQFALNWLKNLEKKKAIKFIEAEINRLERINCSGCTYQWHELKHVIIIPHWKEPYHILEDTINRIRNMNYPTKNISIMLGAEARDSDGLRISQELKAKYEQYFDQIWVNNHILQENEIIGKSSNMFSASQQAYEYAQQLGWDLKKTTVTSCDADSQLPSDYFANVSYMYITEKDAEYKYYTGAVLLYSNIWKLPFFARVKNSMSTLYNVAKMVRTDKLIPFSTYTLSFWMVKEIGFWSPNVTPEDFHTFFKGMFKYPKKVSTVPIFQRIMSDAAEGDTMIEAARNNYLQERRWAWGISDDGWMLKNVIKNIFSKDINFRLIYIALHSIWDHLAVGVSVLITFGGNIIVLVNPRFGYTVLGVNLPRISSFLIQMTLVFFVFTILLDRYIKPEPKNKKNLVQTLFGFVEWFLQPIVGTVLVILPGIEAHTRLLFGRYLEYYLTKKK
jgi:hypothetical protein